MQLSEKAKNELKKLLFDKFGDDAKNFSDEDINNLGVRLIKLTALALKRKVQIKF